MEEPNKDSLEIIQDLDKFNHNVSLEYRDQNILNIDTHSVNWLRYEVNYSVIDYFIAIVSIILWIGTSMHGQISYKGDYHDAHNHPHLYLSCTYYLKVPNTQKNY